MSESAGKETRERILEVTETLLGEQGYHGTRLRQIAERVGIQKASIFHHFQSKEHLYRAVVAQSFDLMGEEIQQVLQQNREPLDALQTVAEKYVELVAAHRERTKILLRFALGDAPSDEQLAADGQRLLDMLVRYVSMAQQAQLLRPIDPLALVTGVVGMASFLLTSVPDLGPGWAQDPLTRASVERVKRHVVEVVRRCLVHTDVVGAQTTEFAMA